MKLIKKSITLISSTLLLSGLALQTTTATASERINLGGLEAIIDFEDFIKDKLEPEFNRGQNQPNRQERHITLYPRDQIFAGKRNPRDTAFLKRMIKNQYPRLHSRLDQFRLQSATVVGRSVSRRYATSTLSLEIDGRYHMQAVLGQGRRRPDQTTLYSQRGRQNQGTWQIKFQGRTEVESIQLHLKKRRGGGRGLGVSFGSQKVQNFKVDKDTFSAPGGSVRGDQITVQATRGKVKIHEVKVNFANGRSRVLHNMSGTLNSERPRQSHMTQYLNNLRNVVSVSVKASSTEIRFPEAKIQVYVK